MELRTLLFFAAAASATVLAGCVTHTVGLARAPITIATGTPGSTYHPVGNAICRLFNLTQNAEAGACIAVSSEGSLANLQRIHRGETTLGLAQSDVAYAAFRGEGPFAPAGPDPALQSLIALHSESFTIMVRADSGISDFRGLRGKRIGLGTRGAGYAVTRDTVLGFYGWTISDFDRLLELGPAEQNRTLCGNIVDAIIFEAEHPDGLTQEATSECGARLVPVEGAPIDRLLAAHPYFVESFIPGGLYAGNPDNVSTFGTRTLLLTSARLSDDLAYALVKAVLGDFADFARLHPALVVLKPEDMVPSEAVIPIHPGALRYFREAGLVR